MSAETPVLSSRQTVAIIGRPNVGKSTLFNLLSQGDKAITHATAGTTRDVRRVAGELFGLTFTLLDTAGIEDFAQKAPKAGPLKSKKIQGKTTAGEKNNTTAPQIGLQQILNEKARYAAEKEADILLLLLDAGIGLVPADRALAQFARATGKPVLVLANKADLKTAHGHLEDFETLGLGAAILISAAHSQGLEDLFDALTPLLPPPAAEAEEPAPEEGPEVQAYNWGDDAEEEKKKPFVMPDTLRIAILGRPNVGKSTLVNALLHQEVMLTGPVAGLTREAISHPFQHNGRTIMLVDTPGLRKKANITENLEELSAGQSLVAIDKADLAILVVDASTYDLGAGTWQVFEQQDARIAGAILNAGKPLIVCLNKWDRVLDREECLKDAKFQLGRRLHQLVEPLAVPVSGIRRRGFDTLLDTCLNVFTAYHARTGTSKLNRVLAQALAKLSPPLAGGRTVALKYITQTENCPPTFAVWGNRVGKLPDSYKLYLRNTLAEKLELKNVPIKMTFRSSRNPFDKTGS